MKSRPDGDCSTLVMATLSILIWMSTFAIAQEMENVYEIGIADLTYEQVQKNWLFVPQKVDLKVTWAVTARETVRDREREVPKDPRQLPFVYQIYAYQENTDVQPDIREATATDHLVFKQLKIGDKFSFKVRMFDAESNLVAESELASIVIGRGENAIAGGLAAKGLLYYVHPGRWQLAMIGKSNIYDRSTTLGKLAFIFLSVTSCLSCLVLVFYSSRTLYLGNVFPYRKSSKSMWYSMFLSCDVSYDNRLTNKFKFVLRAWENIAQKSKSVAEQAVKTIPAGLSSTEKMASVDVACMEYWTNDGDRAIETIEDIISFPYDNSANGGYRSADDLLTDLVIKIEDSFHDIVKGEKSTEPAEINGHYKKEDMKRLIEEIYEPILKSEKPLTRFRTWLLRKGVLDLKMGLRPFPTSRIIHAGLGIHRMNGYRWLKPTEEVKRAFEDRASNEIEMLKRKSKIEWFWNYGALAPLVGLFGTVTGITDAFQELSKTATAPDFMNTIQLLSNGIFEALWTTIFGLANGICFVIIYYYFKHKLDWIFAKWEEIYVNITEKL